MLGKILFVFLPYVSAAIFIFGILYRTYIWARTPVPLRIVTTPAPRTRGGIILRLIGDALWFPNLFAGDKILWGAGFSFHMLLWFALLRHLRYFLYPIPGWVEGIQTLGLYAGYMIPFPLVILLGRRLVDEKALFVSILEDYFSLLLLLTITVSGILLGLFFRTYIVDIKAMTLGLIHFQPIIPTFHWLFGLHFLLVMILLIYFPFSKLMHSIGLFFSPTRYQRANFEQRHINSWDFPVSYNEWNLSTPEKYHQTLGESKKE